MTALSWFIQGAAFGAWLIVTLVFILERRR
jgi:hypothetical protein